MFLVALVHGTKSETNIVVDKTLKIPANVSGTFKGRWVSVFHNETEAERNNSSSNSSVKATPLDWTTSLQQTSKPSPTLRNGVGTVQDTRPRERSLHKAAGVAIFQLVTMPTDHPDVHYVQGEMVIREGLYVTENDVHLQMEGVYLRSSGSLRTVMNSDMLAELTAEEYGDQAEEYRTALRKVATDLVFRGHLPESARAELAADGPSSTNNASQGLGALNMTLQKRCRFKLVGRLEEGGEATWNGERKQPPDAVSQLDSSALALEFSGMLSSPNCREFAVQINTTSIRLQAYYEKAINYTLLVTIIAFAQVVLMVRQMEYSNIQAAAAKVSLLLVGQQAIMDAYLCLLHLTVGIVMEQLFSAFATAAFFQFLVFSVFEMRYMLTIWKARQAPQLDTWSALRHELSLLYSRFYGLMLLGILLIYQMQSLVRYVLFFFHSFWWPQIVRNVTHDVSRPLHPHYILGMSSARLLIPLYIYGCPHNFMRQAPDFQFCVHLVAYVAVQVAVLLSQHYLGPRWFIPARFLPTKYSYFRKTASQVELTADIESGNAEVDCVICMNGIQINDANRRMVTPCDHFFHPQCLQRWMDVKMECPTCRRALPPL